MSIQKVKYPRTLHFPWSPGTTSDDRILTSTNHFVDKEVVVTEKMDGENTTISKDFVHARSLDSAKHPSRWYVTKLQGEISHEIPEHIRICGENCYAMHSIEYSKLEDFFLVFSIWDGNKNVCLSWDETVEWCSLLGLKTVPVLYRGIYDKELIKRLYVTDRKPDLMEGYVVRLASEFHYNNFSTSLAKMVRKGHVQTDEHWMNKEVVPNKLKMGLYGRER